MSVDGYRMQKGCHYWETYAPVVSWKLICILLKTLALYNLYTVQLDFVLEFLQDPVEKDLYMDTPTGFDMSKVNIKYYVLNIHCNIYGQKQAGRVWNQHLVSKIVRELNFVQSKDDKFELHQGTTIYAHYTDG